jgi:serine kinase of HPr protein (carbohydrate metabolism regulator)
LTASPDRITLSRMKRVPGTCVAIDGHGVLLRGPSGCGKSDLALRLIDGGASLVADDHTDVEALGGRLIGRAPGEIKGLLEARGLGILRVDPLDSVELVAVVDLVAADDVARMPEPSRIEILGVALPVFKLVSFEPSAPAKVRLAVRLATGSITSI